MAEPAERSENSLKSLWSAIWIEAFRIRMSSGWKLNRITAERKVLDLSQKEDGNDEVLR